MCTLCVYFSFVRLIRFIYSTKNIQWIPYIPMLIHGYMGIGAIRLECARELLLTRPVYLGLKWSEK